MVVLPGVGRPVESPSWASPMVPPATPQQMITTHQTHQMIPSQVSPINEMYGSPIKGGDQLVAIGVGNGTTTSKRISISLGEESQGFMICPGESGDNIREAVRGAFGLSVSSTFAVRDMNDCNIVMGYPSVVDHGRYRLVLRSAIQNNVSHAVSVNQNQVTTIPAGIPTQVARVPPAGGFSNVINKLPTSSFSQATVQPPSTQLPPPVASSRQQYQELTTTKLPSTDLGGIGQKHAKYNQSSPMPNSSKMLSIGINYNGQKEALENPIKDCKQLTNYLTSAGFHGMQLCLNDDDPGDVAHLPTRDNILKGLVWLVTGAKAGDSLFLHYCGHGVEVLDERNGDGADEALLPVDFRTTRPYQVVRNHEVLDILGQLPYGCRLTIICDCAHSGSMIDLPYSLRARKDGNLEWKEKIAHPEIQSEIICISGWRGDQTTDSVNNCMTNAFIQAITKNENPTYESLVCDLRSSLLQLSGPGYQIPQLACSRKFNFGEVCVLFCFFLLLSVNREKKKQQKKKKIQNSDSSSA